jgi:subtilisin-like proprotein convertase family protein
LQALESRLHLTSVAGKVFYDDDFDGTQEAGESNLSQWVVFLDSNNNNVVDGSSGTYNSTNNSFAIADKTTYTIPINVSGATGTIADVDVRLNITHSYLADLDIYLTAPNGLRVELATDVGGANRDFINTILDDDAAQGLGSINGNTNTGRYRPEASMGRWNGSNINGTWTLEVTDDALGDTGTFSNWGLTIRNGEPDATTWSDGTYLLETAASGSLTVKPVVQSGYSAQRASETVNVAAGGAAGDVNFGVRLPPSNIGGRVFNDLDADGVQDANEPGLSGRSVYLDTNNNGQLDSGEANVLSGSNGDYLFTTLKPQMYTVRTVIPFGWQQTAPASGALLADVGIRDKRMANATPREYVQNQLLVATSDFASFSQRMKSRSNADLLRGIDLSQTLPLSDSLSILTVRGGYDPAKIAGRIAKVTGVEFADLNYVYHREDAREYTPNDPQYSSQTFHTRIGSAAAWDVSEGAGVKVAVIDDGVLLSHTDLAPNIWSNPGEIAGNGIDDDGNGYIDDKNGWDFTNSTSLGTGDSNPNPNNGDSHGTHIAGVIAARTNNATNVSGVAGKATIVPIRFFGAGTWTSTVIYNAFKYAADVGAKIVNVSYNVDGFVDPLDPTYNAAVQYLDSRGVLHINSAGNENGLEPVRTRIESTLYVAAVDGADKKISDSNYGTGVDLSAPGEPILSTTNNNGSASTGTMGGTSVAAAVASGVAALIWARNPTWTREQVVAQLLGTADNINPSNPGHVGLLGSGRVNALKPLTQTLAAPKLGAIEGLPADGANVVVAPATLLIRIPNVLDTTSANDSANWKLTGAGFDGVFGTGDDAAVTVSKSTYRYASNAITFIINSSLSPGLYRFTARSGSNGLRDPFGRALDGNGDGVGGDDADLTFTLSALAPARVVSPTPGSTSSGNHFGTRLLVNDAAPTIVSTSLTLDGVQRLTVTANDGVASISASAITLRNQQSGVSIPSNWYWTYFDPSTRTLLIQLNGGRVFEDARYTLLIAAGGVLNQQGQPMASDYVFNFTFNRADFNRSGQVDIDDLLTLAQNYGRAGVFSNGDSNYDGVVNFDDLLALGQRYGQMSAAVQTVPEKSQARVVDDLLG